MLLPRNRVRFYFPILLALLWVFAGSEAARSDNHLLELRWGPEVPAGSAFVVRGIGFDGRELAGPFELETEIEGNSFALRFHIAPSRDIRFCLASSSLGINLDTSALHLLSGETFRLVSTPTGEVCTPEGFSVDSTEISHIVINTGGDAFAFLPSRLNHVIDLENPSAPAGAPRILSTSTNASIRCVQRILSILSLDPGATSGSIDLTTIESAAELRAILGSSDPPLSEQSAFEWCDDVILLLPLLSTPILNDALIDVASRSGTAFVVDAPSNAINRLLETTDVSDFVDVISSLVEHDLEVLPARRAAYSVVYLITGASSGSTVNSSWCFRSNEEQSWFCETYEEIVTFDPNGAPLVIINEVFSLNTGQFQLQAWLDGELVARRLVEVEAD